MPKIEPIYIFSECNFAFQLRWGLTIFWQKSIHEKHWFTSLAEQLEPLGIRILSWRWKRANVSQFAVSTLPQISPAVVVRQIRNFLQRAIQDISPQALRSRYSIRSYGTQERKIIEAYVAKQPVHHPVASTTTQELFESLVIENKSVDLSRAKHAQGGIYWYNLHLALVHFERWRCANRELLIATQDVMVGTCAKKGWQLSRLAIVPDHFHLAIGCSLDESPSDVVLSLMNNIAWVHGMKPVLCHSAFMGTFGEYDQRSVVGRQRGEF